MNNFFQYYQSYFDDYTQHLNSLKNYKFKNYEQNLKIINFENFNLRIYSHSSKKSGNTFLVIPSIFNSYKILFINLKSNFIDYLMNYSHVVVVEWLKRQNSEDDIDSYVLDTIFIQEYLINNNYPKLNLIGHCLGGNIASAAIIYRPEKINSLTILTTPWDFLSYQNLTQQFTKLQLGLPLTHLDYIPRVYLQSLFFLLSPTSFFSKIFSYHLAKPGQKEFFFELEEWLLSGEEITKKSFCQLTDEIINNNIFHEKKWQINGKIIDPSQINIPVCQVVAKNDWLVPRETNIILSKTIKKLSFIETEGGHVSYLTSNKIEKFFATYSLWLKRVL